MKTKLIGKKEFNLLLVGLNDSGKNTIINQLEQFENIKRIPSTGFYKEVLGYKGFFLYNMGWRPRYN